MKKLYIFLNKKEKAAYELFRNKQSITIKLYFFLFIKGILNLFETLIRNISGPFGLIIRRYYYKLVFEKMGEDVLIDVGVIFNAPHNISCGKKVWFDSYSVINCPMSKVKIGDYVHIHMYSYLGGADNITISNYCNISAGSRVFTGSINIFADKNLPILNPMMAQIENENRYIKGPVIFEESATVLANCVISPNVILRKGSVLLSNSFLTKSTDEYGVYIGVPAKLKFKRT